MILLLATLSVLSQAQHTLTLDEAVARAHHTRAKVAIAGAIVARARGAYRVAGIVPNPTAQLEADDLAPTRKLTLAQPLSWMLRRGSDRAAGRARIDRASADSTQLLAHLTAEVHRAFFGALAATERLRLVREQTAIADSLLVLGERRLSAGDISALERDQVALEAARALQIESQVREEAQVARVALSLAVGGTPAELPEPLGVLDAGLDDANVELAMPAMSGDGLNRLPFVRAAIADSAAAAAMLRGATLAQVPIPSLVAGREWGGNPEAPGNVILGLAMPLPLWNQGREVVAEARAVARQEAALTAEARLETMVRLAEATIRLEATRTRAIRARDSLFPAARQLRAGTLRLFDAGRIGIFPVFDALRGERDVAQSMVQELLAYQQARADLGILLGRTR